MNKRIKRLRQICDALLSYIGIQKGVVPDGMIADLRAIQARLAEMDQERYSSRDKLVGARSTLQSSLDQLRRGIVVSRKALQIAALSRDEKPILVKASKRMYLPSRIDLVAQDHLVLLKQRRDDATVAQAMKVLEAAIERREKAGADEGRSHNRWLSIRDVSRDEVEAISGKLTAYKKMVTYSIPRDERHQLAKHLNSLVPRLSRRKGQRSASDGAAPATGTVHPIKTPR